MLLNHVCDIIGAGHAPAQYGKNRVIFTQGDPADSVFYVQYGNVKLTALSARGKEGVIALQGEGTFFGESCLAGQTFRAATARTLSPCSLVQLAKTTMSRKLHDEPAFTKMFIAHLIARNIRVEEDLSDQLFNSSEKRLARTLLLLATSSKDERSHAVIPHISQETLAEIVGTTRSRVSFFLNKFRKMGLIEYNGAVRRAGLHVHTSRLNVMLHD